MARGCNSAVWLHSNELLIIMMRKWKQIISSLWVHYWTQVFGLTQIFFLTVFHHLPKAGLSPPIIGIIKTPSFTIGHCPPKVWTSQNEWGYFLCSNSHHFLAHLKIVRLSWVSNTSFSVVVCLHCRMLSRTQQNRRWQSLNLAVHSSLACFRDFLPGLDEECARDEGVEDDGEDQLRQTDVSYISLSHSSFRKLAQGFVFINSCLVPSTQPLWIQSSRPHSMRNQTGNEEHKTSCYFWQGWYHPTLK